MVKKLHFTLALMLMTLISFGAMAARPQSGTYTIQNVGTQKFVKVTGKYAASPSVGETDASKISFTVVGADTKHNDGSYRIMGLSSTYTDAKGNEVTVNVDDHIKKALTIGEVVLREELKASSEENVKKAVKAMNDFVNEWAWMRIKPVAGATDTYYAIATTPAEDAIPADVLAMFYEKVTDADYKGHPELGAQGFLQWGIKKVKEYLSTHGTDAGLAGYITRNIDKIDFNTTYVLGGDNDNTFGYSVVAAGGSIPTAAKWQWKLTKDEAPESAVYKIHNVGQDKWVKIVGPYYAKPAYTEAEATEIAVTIAGQDADGNYKVTNLSGDYNGKTIDILNYIDKAILLGKAAVASKLQSSSAENVAKAQEYMEQFIRTNAFMLLKPVPSMTNTYMALGTIPEIPAEVKAEFAKKYPNEDMFEWCKQIVVDYLGEGNGGTNSTLKSYVLNNIENAKEGATYYLSAEADGTFGYVVAPADESDQNLWWGLGEQTKPESGVYKIVNKQTLKYIKVNGKYNATPNQDDETTASEISFQLMGPDTNFNDGSYAIRHLSSTYVDANGKEQTVDIEDYIAKAIGIGNTVLEAELKKSAPENVAKAKAAMKDFVEKWAYMRIKPVEGSENTYYALATVPHVPADIVAEFNKKVTDAKYQGEDGMLQWGIDKVKEYLGEKSTDSGLKAYILNNIDNLKIGRTYMLRADDDGTFGYDYYDTAEMPASKAAILRNQWMLDKTDVIDEMGEVRTIKVRNVGKADVSEDNAYVKIIGRYYAKPNYSEDEATPIQVTIEQQNADGTYKVSDLAGDYNGNYISIKNYVEHAIDLGKAAIDRVLGDVSSPDNVALAKQMMEELVRASAFMTLKAVPGETDTYYAIGAIPTIPEEIKEAFAKKYPGEDMFEWCKNYVLQYLENHNGTGGVNSTLATYIKANLANAKEGHTYYLTAHETDGTFNYVDATENGVVNVEKDRYSWWGMADALIGDPVNGYVRIRNAGNTNYVHVTGPFAAQPNATEDDAITLPGTIIYVGMDEEAHGNAYLVNTLRSQAVNVNDYFATINGLLQTVAGVAGKMVTDNINETSYSKYAGMVEPMIQTLLGTVDVNVYAEPAYTDGGEVAYMLKATTPDLAYYCELANDALTLIGKDKNALVNKLKSMEANAEGMMKKLYNAAWRAAQYLDDPDTLWEKLLDNVKDEWFDRYLSATPELAEKIKNNFRNINYGTTYCLIAEQDKSFGLMERDEALNSDYAKWVLEEDPELEFGGTQHGDYTFTPEQKPYLVEAGESKYMTLFTDFDMDLLGGTEAYIVTESDNKEDNAGNKFYLAKCVKLSEVKAQTPVLLRVPATGTIRIKPVGTPDPKTAVESAAYVKKFGDNFTKILDKLRGSSNAPSRAPQVDENNNTNLLVGTFFGEDVSENAEFSTLMPLGVKEVSPMKGLGFWKDYVSEMNPNESYLFGGWMTDIDNAPGYVLEFEDNTVTEITNVATSAEVVSVRYISVAGIVSDRPFAGVNIVETVFSDGTKAVTKMIK